MKCFLEFLGPRAPLETNLQRMLPVFPIQLPLIDVRLRQTRFIPHEDLGVRV